MAEAHFDTGGTVRTGCLLNYMADSWLQTYGFGRTDKRTNKGLPQGLTICRGGG